MIFPAMADRTLGEFQARGVKFNAFNPQGDAQRISLWKNFERVRAGFYGQMSNVMLRGLQDQVAFVLDNVRQSRTPSQTVNAVRAATYRMRPIYEQRVRQLTRTVIPEFVALTAEGFGKAGHGRRAMKQEPDDVDYWLNVADNYVTENAGTLITAPNETTRQALMQAARVAGQRGLNEGWGMDRIAQEIATEAGGMVSRRRATVIARTEVIRASNFASIATARSTNLALKKEWIAELDDRVRPTHEAADSQIVGLDESFVVGGFRAMYPGDPSLPASESVQCFLPDQLVDVNPSNIRAGYRAPYEGLVHRVQLSNGNELAVTPNHPVLTPGGWVACGELGEGDHLVESRGLQSRVTDFDVQDEPAEIEKVYDSLAGRGVRVGRGIVDFYGDRPSGDVDVVFPDGLLEDGRDADRRKGRGNPPLPLANLRERSLLRERALSTDAIPMGLGLGAHRSIGGSRIPLVFLRRALGHHSSVGLGVAPAVDPVLAQDSLDDGPTDPVLSSERIFGSSTHVPLNDLPLGELNPLPRNRRREVNPRVSEASVYGPLADGDSFCDFFDGLESGIETAEVVNVDTHLYSGYVYTLETASSVYSAGGIVSRNCRCTLAYIPIT